MDAGVGGGKKKKAREIKFPKKKNVRDGEGVTGTQFGVSFCGSP